MLTHEKVNLFRLTEEAMIAFVQSLGAPAYRARQIMHWLYRKGAETIDVMTDLPRAFRSRLAENCVVALPEAVELRQSADGTRKFLFRLTDGVTIESVLIRDGSRLTACLSSQAGCGIGCPFCATALGGLERNLRTEEIVGQLVAMQRLTGERVTNVVMMGMGEPLANYRSVLGAIRLLNHPQACGIGQRHITVSTSGVVPGIRRLAMEGLQIGLAVSLHAPNDALRNQLVPLNRRYPIAPLLAACREYFAATGRRVTLEYVLIDGLNDTPELAEELGVLLRDMNCLVNLIPLNPVPGTGFRRPEPERIADFAAIVRARGVRVTLRREMGTDIDAACGQLRRVRRLQGVS